MSSPRLLCKIGVHRWERRRNKENGAPYLECAACHKEKDTLTMSDYSGSPGA